MVFHFRRLFTRTAWLQIHTYLGVMCGLFFALIGLSGSLCVYREEIDTLLNPELMIEPTQSEPMPLDKIFAELRKAHPNRHGAWTLELPRHENAPIIAWFEKPQESLGKFYAPLMVAIDPYRGRVINSRFWGQTLVTWLVDFHSHLHLAAKGRTLLALLAVLMCISIGSGLYLWWPGFGNLSKAFLIRHRAGLMRLSMDVHRLLGFCSAGFLLLLAFTGFHLAYPQLLETLTAASGMAHGDVGPTVESTAQPNDHPISIDEAVLVARGLFPSSEVRRITTPQGELGTYRINLRQKRELNQRHPFTTVWVDRWSGQIRAVNNPSQFSAGQVFTTWQWPLHSGEAFGSRLAWFILGLMPLILWMTGLSYWLYRKGWLRDRHIDLVTSSKSLAKRLLALAGYHGKRLTEKLKPQVIAVIRAICSYIKRESQ